MKCVRYTGLCILFSLLLALPGCGGLLDPGPPAAVYSLTPTLPGKGAAGGKSSVQLAVALPQADEMLSGNRIITRYPDGELRAWKGVAWASSTPGMFRQLLIAGYESMGSLTALPADAAGFNADYRLVTEIRHFNVVLDEAGKPSLVQIRVAAHIMDLKGGRSLGYLNSDSRAAVQGAGFEAVLAAFNRAAAESINEICVWSVGLLPSAPSRR